MGIPPQLHELICRADPRLLENRGLTELLSTLGEAGAAIPLDLADLKSLLQPGTLFRVLCTKSSTMKGAALKLQDQHPEFSSARGMLRCYEVPADFQWADCESAEIAIGDALVMDTYGWEPDAFTVVVRPQQSACRLTALLAYR